MDDELRSEEYIGRAGNFITMLKRSMESGVGVNWSVASQQLRDLFYQTHKDGVSQGQKLSLFHQQEKDALVRALDRLMVIAEKQAFENSAQQQSKVLNGLHEQLVTTFRNVVVESLDLSSVKLDLMAKNFVDHLKKLGDEVKNNG